MSRAPRAPTGEDAGSSGNGRPRNEADDSERLLLAPDEQPGGTDAPAWLVLGAQATAEVAGARASLQSAHRGRAEIRCHLKGDLPRRAAADGGGDARAADPG